MYVRIGTCIACFSLNYIFCHMFAVCEIMYKRLVHVYYVFFSLFFLIHVVLGLNACPCEFLYMYISVVSEGLMED